MQSTYDDYGDRSDDFSPEETRDIPLFGFITGSLISFVLWVGIAWMVWLVSQAAYR